ncbi:MAG: recombinase RecA [Candidatus Roizmanbacteria bacterium]
MKDGQKERNQAVEVAIEQIQKQFGKGAIMRLGDKVGMQVEKVSTGILTLDLALGIGGIPKGRIIEIYGPESSGKTTVSLSLIAQVQREGGIAAFVDAEHALDPSWAKILGVDVDNLLVSQPDAGEQALEITEALIRSGGVDIVVVDSVAALVPRSEIEGEMGDSSMGVQARLMSQALRKLTAVVSKSKTIVVFTNQLRLKIGVMFGNPETTPGGLALKFYASIRMDVRKTESIKKGDEVVGSAHKVKVVKNKVAPPFKIAIFTINARGIDREDALIEAALQYGVLSKSGAFIRIGEKTLGQGKANVAEFLRGNPELKEKLEKKVLEAAAPKDPDEKGKPQAKEEVAPKQKDKEKNEK